MTVGNFIPGEAEAKASKRGWRPQTEWQGDPEEWRTAEQFNEVWEMSNPRLRRESEALRREVAGIRTLLKDLPALKQELEAKTRAELQAELAAAVEKGDLKAATEITNKVAARVAAQQPEHVETNPDELPAWKDFKADNDWYGKDESMTDYANGVGQRILRRFAADIPIEARAERVHAFASSPEYYEAVERETKTFFDWREPQQQTQNKESVSPDRVTTATGKRVQRNTSKTKTFDNLTPEAQVAAREAVQHKWFKTVDEYVSSAVVQNDPSYWRV